MKTLSISKVKATLSEQVRLVKRGQEVIITERGRPVARLVPVEPAAADEDLERLARAGLVRPGTGLPKSFWELPRPRDRAGSVLAAVLDEREADW